MNGVSDARISTTLPSHPKYRKLKRRHGAAGAAALIELWVYTAGNRPDGNLAGLTNEDIALAADWEGDADQLVNTLADVGFLDGDAGTYRVHDWQDHQGWAAGSEKRKEAAKKAAQVRWDARLGRNTIRIDSDAEGNADRIDSDATSNAERCEPHAKSSDPQCPISFPSPSPSPIPTEQEKTPTASASSVELSDRETIYRIGKPLLVLRGETEKSAANYLGKLVKDHGEVATAAAVRDADRDLPVDPKAWLKAAAARNANGQLRRSGLNGHGSHVGLSTKDYGAGLDANGRPL